MSRFWKFKKLWRPLALWLILAQSLSGCYMRLTVSDLMGGGSGSSLLSPSASPPSLLLFQAPQKMEGNSLQFTVQLTGPLTTDLEFDYSLVDGSAQGGIDYTGASGHMIIPAGQTEIIITVPSVVRSGYQGNREFQLKIENLSNAEIVAPQIVGQIEEANLSPGLYENKNINALKLTKFQVGSKLFFIGNDLDHGQELWVTDGTPAGTKMVMDIFPGPGPSSLSYFFVFNDVLYFQANDGIHGTEAWRSDGTSAGTYLAFDSVPGPADGFFSPHILFKGSLYFTGPYNENGGTQIYRLTQGSPDVITPFFTAEPADPQNPGRAQWNSGTFVIINDTLYFEGHLHTNSCLACSTSGLYTSTDGSTWSLLKDVSLGNTSHNINWLRNCGNKLYFQTWTGFTTSNDQIWVSDGTAAGTVIAKTINATGSAGNSYMGCLPGDRALEWATNGTNGLEPWVTNGTSAGTFQLQDINAGSLNSMYAYPMISVPLNGKVIFSAVSNVYGNELWVTDGTSAGTVVLKDFEPGTGSSSWDAKPGQTAMPNNWVIFQNELYFYIRTPNEGFELWKTDGTPSGTTLVKDIFSGTFSSFPHDLIEFDGKLLFVAKDTNYGQEIWATDGTTGGTQLYLDLNPGAASSAFANLTVLNPDTLVFSYSDQQNHQARLAAYNRLTQTTTPLTTDPVPDEGMGFNFLVKLGQQILFAADDGSWGQKIYQTDLSKNATGLLIEISPYGGCSSISNVGLHNSDYYFLADSPEAGKEIWVTDGTSSGTMLFKDIVPGTQGLTSAQLLTELNGSLLFSITKADTGNELWTSDGTASGTSLLKDVESGAGNGFIDGLGVDTTVTPNLYYFQGNTAATGYEVFKTDGTTANTVMMAEQRAGSTGASIYGKAWVNGKLALSMYGNNGTEFYIVSNGSISTKDIIAGTTGSVPGNFKVVGNTLFFTASTSAAGQELWKSDGTIAGTSLVKDIYAGSSSSSYSSFYPLGSKIVFTATTATTGYNPWVSDGTAGGTVQLKDFETTTDTWYNFDSRVATLNNKIYFPRREEAANLGDEIYVTDGTPGGTLLLKDFEPGPNSSILHGMWINNNELYIAITIPSLSPFIQIWKSDGTTTGTVPLKTLDNINYANGGSVQLFKTGATMSYFTVKTADLLYQIWQTNGTPEGTKISLPATGLDTQFLSLSSPNLFDGDALLYIGNTALYGSELYVVYPQ